MRTAVYIVIGLGIFVLLLAFLQLFVRYEYVAVGGRSEVVFRVDRLTGATCVAFPNRECPPPWRL